MPKRRRPLKTTDDEQRNRFVAFCFVLVTLVHHGHKFGAPLPVGRHTIPCLDWYFTDGRISADQVAARGRLLTNSGAGDGGGYLRYDK
eukprot:scaffold5719_cov194-Skeletonema_menzelii.AAC.3